jgi:uncharacterized protein (TIGR02118 family)
MIKVVSVIKRRSDMSVEAFQDYWSNQHSQLVVQLPSLSRYVQSHTRLSGYKNRKPAVDGVSELWFDDTDALVALQNSPLLSKVAEDENNFIDMSSYVQLLVEEHVIKDGEIPDAGVKNIEIVHRKSGMQVEAFQKHWRETHGPLGAAIPQVDRYVQNHARLSSYQSGREPQIDGLALTWFDDVDAMRASGKSREYDETRADEDNFVKIPLDFVIATEHVILE